MAQRLAAAARMSPRQIINRARAKLAPPFPVIVPSAPRELMAFITRRCNLHCGMCPFVHPAEHGPASFADISRERFAEFLARFAGAESIGLVGGEPFLHPELFNFIRMAAGHRMRVSLATNGLLLDNDRISRLLDSPLAMINISLDADTPERYRAARGGSPIEFNAIITAVNTLAAERTKRGSPLEIVMSHVTSVCTAEAMPAYVDFAARLGANGVIFQNLIPYECSPATRVDQTLTDTPDNRARVAALLQRHNPISVIAPKLRPVHRPGFFCPQPYRLLSVDGDGNIAPCCIILPHSSYGNVFTDKSAWNGAGMRRIRQAMRPGHLEDIPTICLSCWENEGHFI